MIRLITAVLLTAITFHLFALDRHVSQSVVTVQHQSQEIDERLSKQNERIDTLSNEIRSRLNVIEARQRATR
ncbi:hypothetical protein [Stutzerimonas decontaminans]|uniref:Uncharacterized protein n=1 Tax=Stutzerimonas stutzeri TaxID=316 RepID=A0A023WYS4_STUST|nr:hypothetical protein [Stutzerimonas decontaminans]AHY45076.1 hypothetical protein UIB01_07065 [Stutzerimonas decontaminans]